MHPPCSNIAHSKWFHSSLNVVTLLRTSTVLHRTFVVVVYKQYILSNSGSTRFVMRWDGRGGHTYHTMRDVSWSQFGTKQGCTITCLNGKRQRFQIYTSTRRKWKKNYTPYTSQSTLYIIEVGAETSSLYFQIFKGFVHRLQAILDRIYNN